jgi:hypothetical protein
MKNIISKVALVFLLTFAFSFTTIETANAQCPMCKMSAESNMKNGGTAGKGLNKGILYMFAAPYVLIAGLGFAWYKINKNKREAAENDEIQSLLD